MKPKTPAKCPDCGKTRITLTRVFSRVYAEWRCESCGSEWRADAATGRLITRLNYTRHLEGEALAQ